MMKTRVAEAAAVEIVGKTEVEVGMHYMLSLGFRFSIIQRRILKNESIITTNYQMNSGKRNGKGD